MMLRYFYKWYTFNKSKLYQIIINKNKSKRIYFYHIRKTGGTAINHAFLSLGNDDPKKLYEQLSKSLDHRVVSNNRVFAGWNKNAIESGIFNYAFSHMPMHVVQVPDNIFTFTCFRDPIKRVLSHYKMLRNYSKYNVSHVGLEQEIGWYKDDISTFIEAMPKEHLFRQLYMFSANLDVDEALTNIQKLSEIIFLEDIDSGFKKINARLDLNLKIEHIRKSGRIRDEKDIPYKKLRDILKPEYDLITRVKRNTN